MSHIPIYYKVYQEESQTSICDKVLITIDFYAKIVYIYNIYTRARRINGSDAVKNSHKYVAEKIFRFF
jgi:hypothetical protein